MEGLRFVQARIATITQKFEPTPTTSTPLGSPSASSRVGLGGGASGTFDQFLTGALGTTPATQLSPGSYGALTPPDELRSFGNGQIPASQLTEIGVGQHRLSADAAAAFKQMRVAASAAGVDIGVTDSYRSLDQQVNLAQRKGLYSQGGLAAEPGTSNHGWGLAVDVDVNPTGQAWLRANGARFGFVEDVPREPWHWTYRPS